MRELLGRGVPYSGIGERLGIPAGQAYLIGTGMPADGSDAHTPEERARPGVLASSQHLLGVPAEQTTSQRVVAEWVAGRVAADEQMRRAGATSGKG